MLGIACEIEQRLDLSCAYDDSCKTTEKIKYAFYFYH